MLKSSYSFIISTRFNSWLKIKIENDAAFFCEAKNAHTQTHTSLDKAQREQLSYKKKSEDSLVLVRILCDLFAYML